MARAAAIALVLVAAVTGAAATAAADDPMAEVAARYQAATEATQRAQTDDEWAAAGAAWVALAGEPALADRADESLWYAAIAFGRARSLGASLMVLRELVRNYPQSKLVPDALVMTARLQLAVADHAGAAASFADHAARYPADTDALDSLENVALLRYALADDEAARRAVEQFVRTYGAKAPLRAFEVAERFARLAELDGRDPLADALYPLALTLAKAAPAGQALEVRGRAALRAWRATCPGAGPSGLCVRFDRKRGVVVAVPRDARAADLKKTLAAVAAQAGPDVPVRVWTRLALADAEAEALLALGPMPPVPPGGGAPRPQMLRAVRWLQDWMAQAKVVQAAYTDGELVRDPRAAVAALAHLATVAEAWIGLVATVHLPGSPLDGQVPLPLDVVKRQTLDAATLCLRVARDQGLAGGDAAICDGIVTRVDPAAYPPLRERSAPFAPPPPLTSAEP